MIYSTITVILIFLAGCLTSTSLPGITTTSNAGPTAVAGIDTIPSVPASVAFAAVDRQCGSCHHSYRSANAGALAIFNLADPCWYCNLTPEQRKALQGRLQGSSFSDKERASIVALIAHLSPNDITTD